MQCSLLPRRPPKRHKIEEISGLDEDCDTEPQRRARIEDAPEESKVEEVELDS